MNILGIDPGVKTVGIGLIDWQGQQTMIAVDWLTIETESTTPHAERLREIAADLKDYIQTHKPGLIVIEKLFMTTNQKTAIAVAEARGAILLTAAEANVPLLEVTPLQLKQSITGDGKADKKQVQTMVMRMLRLTEEPKPDDAADGLALALYGGIVYPTLQSAPDRH